MAAGVAVVVEVKVMTKVLPRRRRLIMNHRRKKQKFNSIFIMLFVLGFAIVVTLFDDSSVNNNQINILFCVFLVYSRWYPLSDLLMRNEEKNTQIIAYADD